IESSGSTVRAANDGIYGNSTGAITINNKAAIVGNDTNLLTNGGFETGSFSGWTVKAGATGVQTAGYDGENPHSGTYFAALGDTSSSFPFGTLSQTVADKAGQNLTLSYYLESDGRTAN